MALSYSHGSSNTPLIGETIGGFFDKIVAKYPERDAVVANHQNIRYSYIELRKAVDRFAKARAKEMAVKELGLERAKEIKTA